MPAPRSSLLLTAVVAGCLVSCAPADEDEGGPTRPHVVLWLVDTLRADHLSCYGYERPTSPRLDALADEGVLFEELHTPSNWTQPSMASLFTGRWPDRFDGGFGSRLAEEHLTAAEWFSAHGYATAGFTLSVAVGERFGFAQGFGRFEELDAHVDERERTKRQGRQYDADVLVERAFTWLDDERQGDQPFLLYLHSMDPHLPHEQHPGHPSWTEPYDGPLDGTTTTTFTAQDEAWPLSDRDRQHMRDLYDGEVAFNDACLGTLVDGLAERGLDDDTLLVVLSDHGEELWDRSFYGHGHDSLHREMTRVPLVLRWPGELPAGRRVPGLARGVDLLPTLLELVGLPPVPSADGVSLAAATRGAGEVPPDLQAFSLRGRRHDDPRALRTSDAFVYANPRTGEQGLYLLSADPDERQDLSRERPRDFLRAAGPLSQWIGLLKTRADAGPEAVPVELDPETEAKLRALGYLR
jgi:arylsulfatase A-like enzyme